jgi:hypothetical protein
MGLHASLRSQFSKAALYDHFGKQEIAVCLKKILLGKIILRKPVASHPSMKTKMVKWCVLMVTRHVIEACKPAIELLLTKPARYCLCAATRLCFSWFTTDNDFARCCLEDATRLSRISSDQENIATFRSHEYNTKLQTICN